MTTAHNLKRSNVLCDIYDKRISFSHFYKLEPCFYYIKYMIHDYLEAGKKKPFCNMAEAEKYIT